MSMETLTGIMAFATGILAFATVWLAFSTRRLAQSTDKMLAETHEASVRQLGVETWLRLAARFDSEELRRSRVKLAGKLENYDPSKHDEITEEVLDLFEDIGTLYKLGLINKNLADSSFSYYASRLWEVAKTYIYQERERSKDKENELFSDFEAFAKEMRRPDEKLDSLELKKFLNDEKYQI
jgi:(p)ppGpp synthase/HD superfamily hydrolase